MQDKNYHQRGNGEMLWTYRRQVISGDWYTLEMTSCRCSIQSGPWRIRFYPLIQQMFARNQWTTMPHRRCIQSWLVMRELFINCSFSVLLLFFNFFLHHQFGEVKLTDHLGGCQKWSLLDVGLSKPDKPAFIQHTFVSCSPCTRYYTKETEIQWWAQALCHAPHSLVGDTQCQMISQIHVES